jgi:hypothetical protein
LIAYGGHVVGTQAQEIGVDGDIIGVGDAHTACHAVRTRNVKAAPSLPTLYDRASSPLALTLKPEATSAVPSSDVIVA